MRREERTPKLTNKSVRQPAQTNVRTTVADLLVEAHPCCCVTHAERSVERFRYLGSRKRGMWFDDVLDSQEDELTSEDSRYLRGTWEQWLAGEDPFRLRRRRVTT